MEICPQCHEAYGDKLFCQACGYHVPGLTFTSIASVPWGESEGYIFNTDKKTSIKATDHFLDERSKWTATSSKLRKWEKDRKSEWAKNKPAWRKEQAKKGVV